MILTFSSCLRKADFLHRSSCVCFFFLELWRIKQKAAEYKNASWLSLTGENDVSGNIVIIIPLKLIFFKRKPGEKYTNISV